MFSSLSLVLFSLLSALVGSAVTIFLLIGVTNRHKLAYKRKATEEIQKAAEQLRAGLTMVNVAKSQADLDEKKRKELEGRVLEYYNKYKEARFAIFFGIKIN